MGGLLPTRASQLAPEVELEPLVSRHDPLHPDIPEFVAPVHAYRDRAAEQVETVATELRVRLDRARQHRQLGESRVRWRTASLGDVARELSRLTERLDWMPVV